VESSHGAAERTILLGFDAARALASEIARGPGGREVALTITKLEEALHWLEAAKGR